MSRRPDPARIHVARREATIARLISAGELPDRAAALIARYEAQAAADGRDLDRGYWEGFDAWRAAHGRSSS